MSDSSTMNRTGPLEVYRNATEKPILALDALSKLTRQFANRPDFHHLVNLVLLTVSGQFSVTSAFAVVFNRKSSSSETLFFGSGKFHMSQDLARLAESEECLEQFRKSETHEDIDAWLTEAEDGPVMRRFHDSGVQLVAPLLQGDEIIGLIGLAGKVNGAPFAPVELNLLGTLAGTITPLIVNSLLFMEINSLSAWYLDILNNVRQGVFVFDAEDRLKNVNLTGRSLLGSLHPELMTAVPIEGAFLDQVFPEEIFPGWQTHLANARRRRNNLMHENMVACGAEGERVFSIGVSLIDRTGSEQSDLIVTLDDVTVQTDREQRFFKLEKFADKGMMAASIAHEMNNFLALIMGGVEMAQINIAKQKWEKVEASLEKLKTNVSTMTRFTAGLVDQSRLDSRMSPGNLNAVVSDVLSFVKAQKRFQRIRIAMNLDQNIPAFELDSDQLAQLLLNFLNNAADAIAEANPPTGEISVTTVHHGPHARLLIADNGIGIPPEVKERLFKAHLTTKETGHGYGLVTCSRILENHQADVLIESEVGEGAIFTINFPL